MKFTFLSFIFQFLVEENDEIQKEKLQQDYDDAYPLLHDSISIMCLGILLIVNLYAFFK